MKNSLLASIALFGVYRKKNLDTYDLVAQYVSAVIAQREYSDFTSAMIQADLKDLYMIEIPIGVIKSVCKNRIDGIKLNRGAFSCTRFPKDEIEKEYNELNQEYDELFTPLIAFVRNDTDEYQDQYIKDRFGDYLISGGVSETKLNNLYAAFISGNSESRSIREKIDLLSSGLISYNGLSYTDSAGSSGAWTEKLIVFLDTEFLFSCAGYHDDYHHAVFQELYDLINEVNQSYHRRTKKQDDLIELRYLKDTMAVYLSIIAAAKQCIETKMAPDPSKKALMRIVQESPSAMDVDLHRSIIDNAIKNTYHILYDDKDYDHYVTDPRYIVYDQPTYSAIAKEYNPTNDDNINRKIDYYSRVYTIINGLRGGKPVHIFEQCRYIFLTGSRIGRGTSIAGRVDSKTVSFATDIDFLVSRLWFKLNKQLVNDRIPVSLDIVARSQAVLTREVSRKVRAFYEELKTKDLSESEKQIFYANLREAEQFLEPYNPVSTEEVLSFIEYTDFDEIIEAQYKLKQRAAEAEEKEQALLDAKEELAQKEVIIEGLKQDIISRSHCCPLKVVDVVKS
ncbi:MAG: hypothetical protein IJV01_05705 [Bacteroidales bacterium]|nr:hypothetical protein [Bacteroidales bacterium]